MTPVETGMTLAVVLLVGVLIGAAGVGGVLLAPWLVHGVGLPVQQAAGIAMLGFVGPGLAALFNATRTHGVGWPVRWAMVVATLPGALAGALLLAYLPERIALLVLAVAVTVVGLRLLRRSEAVPGQPPRSGGGWRTGLVAGFGSALTVTSGAVVLTPLLLWRGVPLPEVIAASQLVQLPIAASATAVNLTATAGFPWLPGLVIAVLLVPGMQAGRRIGGRVPPVALARLVGALLLLAGVLSVGRALG